MTAISNFTQAMKELTGFDDEQGKAGEKQALIKEKEAKREEIKLPQKMNFEMPHFDKENSSLVTSTMVINGNLLSSDQIKVNGKVTGDIKTTQSAMVNGTVLGDIESDSLTVSGSVKGNLTVKRDAGVASTAVIVGDIMSGNLSLEGKVKGNLKITGTTGITETAILAGNIDTSDLYTEKGCVVHGSIITRDTANFNFEEEKLFDIGE